MAQRGEVKNWMVTKKCSYKSTAKRVIMERPGQLIMYRSLMEQMLSSCRKWEWLALLKALVLAASSTLKKIK